MTPNHGPLRDDEILTLGRSFDAASGRHPCYGCGLPVTVVFVCRYCGRVICMGCWTGGSHVTRQCQIPAASPEGQAAERLKECSEGT